MTHPSSRRERLELKQLKDVKVKAAKPSKVWKHGLEALKEWEEQRELVEYNGSEGRPINR